MLTYSLVVANLYAGSVEVIKIPAHSANAAIDEFEAGSTNSGLEILHVIEPEPAQVEIVIDMSGGMIEQVASNHPNTKIVFLDNSKDEITAEVENANGAFAPDTDLSDDPKAQRLELWVFRTAEVDYNPRMTGHYVRYTEDKAAREAFNEQVHQALDNQ